MELTGRKRGCITAIVFIIIVLSIPVLIYYKYKTFLNTPVSKESKDIELRVYKGTNSGAILENLNQKGLIKNKLFAKYYIKKTKLDTSLKVGVYKFNTTMTPVEIFNLLLKGEVDPDVVMVTIPEGFSVRQIADRLYKNGVIKDVDAFIKETNTGKFDYIFLDNIPEKRTSKLEGYLFPATYEFRKTMTNKEIITIMLDKFASIYSDVIMPNMANQKLSADEIMILASMIEKEAVIDEERPLISAVFYNRLAKKMMLKSDPTVEYALGVKRDVVTFKDLEVKSPYNTYKNYGLSIGPICNPGQKAIEAAMNPAKVDYLFFAAKDDTSHFFTKSDKEFMKFLENRSLKK
jgi:UPF0755 protein